MKQSAKIIGCLALSALFATPLFSQIEDVENLGAVSGVSGDDMSKTFSTNVANTLYGKIAGLTVMQSGAEPGNDAPTFRSRGVSTFDSGRDVTVVIDGFPSSYELFQQLSPSEIESVELLKDAAAAAVWGNRGANGVLYVKTKRGQNQPLQLNVKAQYGLQAPTRLPEFLGSYDYATLYNEARVNDYGAGAETYTDADLEAYRTGSDPYGHPDVNWFDQVLRQVSPMANYDLTARGGSSTVKYFVLLDVTTNKGLYEKTAKVSENTKDFSYTRYNFRTNVDIQLSKHIASQFTLGGTVEDRITPGRARNTSGEYSSNMFSLLYKLAPNSFPVYNEDGTIGGNATYYNPWAEITETGYYSTNKRTAQMSGKLTGDLSMITPGLSVYAALSFNTVYKGYTIGTAEYARFSFDGVQYSEPSALSIKENTYSQWRNTVVYGGATYDRWLGASHLKADFMGGFEEEQTSATDRPYKDVVYSGRLTYAYDKRYVVDLSFAYDGTDRFAKGKRFGFFPSAAAGWIISNEDFMESCDAIRLLRLRASYGLMGNKYTSASRFPYNQYYTNGNYYLGTSNSANSYYVQNYMAYPDATWEKERATNIGIDASFDMGLSVQVDVFDKYRYDILATPYSVLPSFVGFKIPNMNIGEVDNKGLEITARFDHSSDAGVNWFVEGNTSFARNRIVFNSETPKTYAYQERTGHRVDQPFVLIADGFFMDQADIDSHATQTFVAVQPGDIKYVNQNPDDDNVIDDYDFVANGYTTVPEWNVGLHAGASYKGFDADIQFQGALNRTVYLSSAYFQTFQNNGQASTIALDRWTPATASTATYPRLSSVEDKNNFQTSSFWQRNGNFLKLRTLEVGYTLPATVTGKVGLQAARVYLNGENLFSLDHMKGMCDPEVLSGYPALRTISLGLGINL